jgi:hypothetical protein
MVITQKRPFKIKYLQGEKCQNKIIVIILKGKEKSKGIFPSLFLHSKSRGKMLILTQEHQ